jgi:hypothetical protein
MDGTRGKRKGNLGIYEGYTPVWAVASKLVDLLGLAAIGRGQKRVAKSHQGLTFSSYIPFLAS